MAGKNASVSSLWVAVCYLPILCSHVCPTNANAIGQLRYANPRDHALGVRGAVAWSITGTSTGKPPPWSFEAGERYLYGLADLTTTHVKITVFRRRFGFAFANTFLSTAIGREYVLSVETLYDTKDALRFALDLNLDALAVHGMERSHLLSAGVSAVLTLSESLRLGYAVENIRLHGETLSGADTGLQLLIKPGASVYGIAQVRLTREGTAGARFGSGLRVRSRVGIALGYEDPSGIIGASLNARLRAMGFAVGASLHPVLGLSKSVFVSWRRGE